MSYVRVYHLRRGYHTEHITGGGGRGGLGYFGVYCRLVLCYLLLVENSCRMSSPIVMVLVDQYEPEICHISAY